MGILLDFAGVVIDFFKTITLKLPVYYRTHIQDGDVVLPPSEAFFLPPPPPPPIDPIAQPHPSPGASNNPSLIKPSLSSPNSLLAAQSTSNFEREERSSHLVASYEAPQDSAKSAVNAKRPTPSILTPQILRIGEQALSAYDLVRANLPEPIEFSLVNPFSACSAEELETYYSAAVDVQKALGLRKSAAEADLGDSLDNIIPKVGICVRDGATLDVVSSELQMIVETCSTRQIDLNFYCLEYQRALLPQHEPSVFERHEYLFSKVWDTLESKKDAQKMADRFIEDPSSLVDYRLPAIRATRIRS